MSEPTIALMSEVLHAHGAVVVDDEPLVGTEVAEFLHRAVAAVLGEVLVAAGGGGLLGGPAGGGKRGSAGGAAGAVADAGALEAPAAVVGLGDGVVEQGHRFSSGGCAGWLKRC